MHGLRVLLKGWHGCPREPKGSLAHYALQAQIIDMILLMISSIIILLIKILKIMTSGMIIIITMNMTLATSYEFLLFGARGWSGPLCLL